ncbi:MAG: zinc-ribbon domain-containing protein [Candidatus Sulfotelmatobacter sp.]
MRCPRCGNENPTTNRFCGMCGMSLLQAPSPAQAVPPAKPPGVASVAVAGSTPASMPATGRVASAAPPAGGGKVASLAPPPVAAPPPTAAVPAPSVPAAPPAPRPAAVADEAPIISGPSFLGLNQPAPAPRRTNPLSIDPHTAPSSSNLDYLLEDDEQERSRGTGWKFVLMLIALVLAAGFGYLRWKGQPLPWIGSGANKPSAAAQSSGAADANSPAPSSSATPAGASSGPTPGASDGAGASPSTASPSSVSPTPTSPTPATSTPAAAAASPANNAQASPTAGASGGGGAGSAATQPSASPAPGAIAPTTAPAAAMRPKPAPAVKPSAVVPLQAADPVALAQKYIYGKRVPQDCDRGLRILKPAADQANAKAMIEMGALYSAGLCTPRDLPTAYRWFALALRKDPDNQALNADLQKLWGEMTQPERELAIKLTQ